MPTTEPTRIEHGIEWFTVRIPGRPDEEDCQCARCGSSCDFRRCSNCDDGEIEREPWDGFGEPYYVPCDWCRGTGGWYHCCSGPEWCAAHPLPGREHIVSTALRAEAWDE